MRRRAGRVLRFDSRLCLVNDEQENRRYTCALPGKFRTQRIRPIVGDIVEFTPTDSAGGVVNAIRNRKNELSRPRVANVDQVILVTSLRQPAVSSYILDRFLVLTEREKLPTIIVVNKIDLLDGVETVSEFRETYSPIYSVVETSAKQRINLDKLREIFQGSVSTLAGVSGVGKSSILNALSSGLQLRVGELSEKLDRGKHTTSSLELLQFSFGGYVADTPGFASLELRELAPYELKDCFAEFRVYGGECSFRDCLHGEEPGCEVKKMVESGMLSKTRYRNYLIMLDELRKQKATYKGRRR